MMPGKMITRGANTLLDFLELSKPSALHVRHDRIYRKEFPGLKIVLGGAGEYMGEKTRLEESLWRTR
jgi:hypothetical protein